MAAHATALAWRLLRTEEPGGLRSTGHTGSDTTEAAELHQQHPKVQTALKLMFIFNEILQIHLNKIVFRILLNYISCGRKYQKELRVHAL